MFTFEFLNFLLFIGFIYLSHKWYICVTEEELKDNNKKLYIFNPNKYESARFKRFEKKSR